MQRDIATEIDRQLMDDPGFTERPIPEPADVTTLLIEALSLLDGIPDEGMAVIPALYRAQCAQVVARGKRLLGLK